MEGPTTVNPPLMGAAGPGTERCDAAANRARILAVAEKLFAERGAAAVTMADIARAAGVGQGTLYRRYASKADLCLALMDRQFREFQDTVMRQITGMIESGASRLEQLAWTLESLAGFAEIHLPLLREAQHGGAPVPNSGPQAPPMMWQYLTVRGLLQAAAAMGEVEGGLDVPLVADLLLAPLQPATFGFYRYGRGYSVARIVAGLKRMVAGLAATEAG